MAIRIQPGMTYNAVIHGYILDKDYYTQMSATNLEDILTADNATSIDAVVNSYLFRASSTLYDYILSFNPRYRKYIQYQLCHDKEFVETIQLCLVDMVNYWVLNGLDTGILNPILNVDVERSVPVISQADMEASLIPLSVKKKIHNLGLDIKWNSIHYDDAILDTYDAEELIYKE